MSTDYEAHLVIGVWGDEIDCVDIYAFAEDQGLEVYDKENFVRAFVGEEIDPYIMLGEQPTTCEGNKIKDLTDRIVSLLGEKVHIRACVFSY